MGLPGSTIVNILCLINLFHAGSLLLHGWMEVIRLQARLSPSEKSRVTFWNSYLARETRSAERIGVATILGLVMFVNGGTLFVLNLAPGWKGMVGISLAWLAPSLPYLVVLTTAVLWGRSLIMINRKKPAEETIQKLEEIRRDMFLNSPDAHIIIVDGRVIDCNPATEVMLRGARNQIIGREPADMSPEFQPDGKRSSEAQGEQIAHALQAGTHRFEWVHRRLDGEEINVEVSLAAMIVNGKTSLFTTWRDITERKRLEQALESANEFHLNLLKNAPALIWRAGPDAKCDWFNRTWLEFTGRRLEDELGDGWAAGVHPDDFERCLSIYQNAFAARQPFEMDYRLRHVSGEYRWISDNGIPFETITGEFGGYIGYCFDITERRQMQEELHQMATTDPLTGIANRRRFFDLARGEMKRALRHKHPITLAILDIDHFKQVNDRYGHHTGDLLLQDFARFCQKNIREIDIIARYGGEEFVILMPETTIEQGYIVVDRLCKLVAHQVFDLAGKQLTITFSAGAAWLNGEDETLEFLLNLADQALYKAKAEGRYRVSIHPDSVQHRVE